MTPVFEKGRSCAIFSSCFSGSLCLPPWVSLHHGLGLLKTRRCEMQPFLQILSSRHSTRGNTNNTNAPFAYDIYQIAWLTQIGLAQLSVWLLSGRLWPSCSAA